MAAAWTTVERVAGTQYVRIRPAGYDDAGDEKAPHLFCTTDEYLTAIALWQWFDAGRPEHFPLTIDTFELQRDVVLISLNAAYGYEELEAALGLPPTMRHVPGELPIGDNRVAAACISGGGQADGWHEAPDATGCIEEVMLVRGTLRCVGSHRTTMADFMNTKNSEGRPPLIQ